ncbi:sensor histidine kinase [Frisingicoccus sp.]|uniref:sensor histidine kinase n=1 Tax=Frisingicoccus sp. TaxID=1918627 RepID=UPI003AB8585F
MEVLNLLSVILDLLAWTALIRLLYCPGLKFDIKFWSYITLIAVIEHIFAYQGKILEAVAIMTVLYPLVLIMFTPVEKKISKFFYSLIIIQFLFIPANMISLIAGMAGFNVDITVMVLYAAIDIVILPFCHKHYEKSIHNIRIIGKSDIAFCLALNIFSLYVSIIIDPAFGLFKQGEQYGMIGLLIIVTVLLNFLFCLLIFRSKLSRYYKTMYQLNNQYMEMELRYFSIYKDSQTELRKYRHDMKNHLLCLHTLCEEENYSEIKKFVRSLTDGWQDINQFYHVGNDIADAIINGKHYMAKEHSIALDVSGRFQSDLKLSALEICTIFSNAIDNAIEENLKIEDESKRHINIEIKQTENFFVVSFENPLSAPVKVSNNSLIPSTKKTADHGFGLLNIKSTAEKNGGYIELDTKKHFILTVVIPR